MSGMEFTPNSNKYKQEQAEEKRVEKPVITSGAKLKKRSGANKLADVFISEDIHSVKSYVAEDIIVPGIKKVLFEIITTTFETLFWGKGGGSSSRRSTVDRFSYNRCYEEPRNVRKPETRGRFEYDDINFTSRGDAERVREELINVIERYGFVTVADYYDMADMSAPFTANKYGWMSIQSIVNADIVRTRDGYIIKLPRAMAID